MNGLRSALVTAEYASVFDSRDSRSTKQQILSIFLHVPLEIEEVGGINPTPEQVANIFNVPVANVRRQYAKNAKQLRAMAIKAGDGTYRGATREELNKLAEMAESKS